MTAPVSEIRPVTVGRRGGVGATKEIKLPLSLLLHSYVPSKSQNSNTASVFWKTCRDNFFNLIGKTTLEGRKAGQALCKRLRSSPPVK